MRNDYLLVTTKLDIKNYTWPYHNELVAVGTADGALRVLYCTFYIPKNMNKTNMVKNFLAF